jgi:hypothetical protein
MKGNMNARALKISVASQNARRCFIVNLTTLLLVTLCSNTATAQGVLANNWSPNQAPVGSDKITVPNSGIYPLTDDCIVHLIKDSLCHFRIRTRTRFDNNFQNDFTVTRDGHIPLDSSGVIVAEQGAAPTVIFVNTATARGPPGSGDQSLYLSDNQLDRPAPLRFSAAPPLSEFHFLDSSSARNATRLLTQSSMVSRAGTLLVAAISQPKTTEPFTSRSNYEIEM